MSKSNKVEIDKRILIISKLLLSGESTKSICYNATLKWSISESQAKRYIRACYALWKRDFEKKRKAGLSYHLSKRRDLYAKAYKQKDWPTCLAIAKDEAKIMDCYPSERHELIVEKKPDMYSYIDNVLMKLTVEENRKLIIIYDHIFKNLSDKEIEELAQDIMFKHKKQKLLEKGGEQD